MKKWKRINIIRFQSHFKQYEVDRQLMIKTKNTYLIKKNILKFGNVLIGQIEQCIIDTSAEKQLSWAATDV